MHTSTPKRPVRALVTLVALSGLLLVAGARAAVTVEAVVAETRPVIEQVPLTGSVSALQLASLSPEVGGLIRRLHVEPGDSVSAGDVLVELDRQLGDIALRSAEARLERARAEEAEARRRLNEARDLVQNNNIAASEVRAREAQMAVTRAERRLAEADRAMADAQLEKHRIRAPFDGTVSEKHADLGEWVSPGAPLLELVSTHQLRVDFQVPQRYYPRVDDQTNLTLALDAAPDQYFTAGALRKVPLSRSGARTFLLRTAVPDEAPATIPGMAVSARLKLDTGRRSVVVPRDALLRYPDGRVSVWVASAGDWGQTVSVSERQVQTGLAFGEQVEISEGLEPGEVVVTRGNEALQSGQSVQLERAAGGQ